ncbi:MAG: hypothetical protein GY811_07040 [Myxococcales bacterium]|nr:hypothetical protein [Myxococcales bacterium]
MLRSAHQCLLGPWNDYEAAVTVRSTPYRFTSLAAHRYLLRASDTRQGLEGMSAVNLEIGSVNEKRIQIGVSAEHAANSEAAEDTIRGIVVDQRGEPVAGGAR